MAAKISHGLQDCTHLQVVSVISSFDCKGNIKPLRVRLGQEALTVYNSCLISSTISILEFNCEIMDGDCVKPLKLSYHITDMVWTIPR